MGGWTLFLCGAAFRAAVILLVWDERRRQHELLRMERMRASALYYQLYPQVVFARKHQLDRVQIERSRVTFYAICPPGRICDFVMAEHGFRPLSPQRVKALAQVIADDIPELQVNAHYKLRRYRLTRPNGQKGDAYLFTIRSRYKTQLMYARQHVRLY